MLTTRVVPQTMFCACGCGTIFTPNPRQPKQKYVNRQHKIKARNDRMRRSRKRKYFMPILCPICGKYGYLMGIYLGGVLSSLEIQHVKVAYDAKRYKAARLKGKNRKDADRVARRAVYLGNCYYPLI